MKQMFLKQTMIAGLLVFNIGMLNGCAPLGHEDQVIEPDQSVQVVAPAFKLDENICSPENPEACVVSFEDADVMLGQAPVYGQMAVATDSAYAIDMAPVSISVPMIEQGLSVKEKMAQKEQEQQDLSLTPVDNADVVCNGDDCENQLFKTEAQKEIKTTITEEKSLRPVTLNDKIAYGEGDHDWEAKTGDTMRTLLRQWGEASGWTVVWKIDRDYHLEAGVVFRGKFTEVAAAFIRSFARATPAPIGTFYKGNRVLVISAQENENAD
ncbi:MAG: toxin co-regulated pilus biosynthesis Q family protein [Alphaproteobacteria bacterium]|nr:toxin co-regulated pilus biosynthesis Q family protein [Alphaproteobacteria bacterium]